jgi:hypothetical protein
MVDVAAKRKRAVKAPTTRTRRPASLKVVRLQPAPSVSPRGPFKPTRADYRAQVDALQLSLHAIWDVARTSGIVATNSRENYVFTVWIPVMRKLLKALPGLHEWQQLPPEMIADEDEERARAQGMLFQTYDLISPTPDMQAVQSVETYAMLLRSGPAAERAHFPRYFIWHLAHCSLSGIQKQPMLALAGRPEACESVRMWLSKFTRGVSKRGSALTAEGILARIILLSRGQDPTHRNAKPIADRITKSIRRHDESLTDRLRD